MPDLLPLEQLIERAHAAAQRASRLRAETTTASGAVSGGPIRGSASADLQAPEQASVGPPPKPARESQ